MTTAAVTGAAGFIGARLVEGLTAHGVKVTAIVRDYGRAARLGRLGVRIVRADMRDADAVAQAVSGADVVFHCAFGWAADHQAERAGNLAGSINVGRAVTIANVPLLVYVSSMAIYGHELPHTVDEDTPPHPTTSYGRTKLEIELTLRELAGTEEVDLRVVRATKAYGPYDFAFTVQTIKKLRSRELWLIEDGRGLVAPSYVDNLVHGLILTAERGRLGSTYVIADGLNLSWRDFYRYFTHMTGVAPYGNYTQRTSADESDDPDAPPEPGETEYRDYLRDGSYSIARAEHELGYKPVLPIDVGMARTEAWLRFAGLLDNDEREGSCGRA